MKPTVTIDIAQANDAEAIFEVQRQTWLDTYPNEQHGITAEDIRMRLEGEAGELIPQKIERWRTHITDVRTNITVFVARLNSKVVGFAAPHLRDGQRRLGALYVLPEAQGYGIGGKLIQKALDWHGNDQDVYLHVASYNDNAIRFYKRYGFTITDSVITDAAAVANNSKPIPELEMIRMGV